MHGRKSHHRWPPPRFNSVTNLLAALITILVTSPYVGIGFVPVRDCPPPTFWDDKGLPTTWCRRKRDSRCWQFGIGSTPLQSDCSLAVCSPLHSATLAAQWWAPPSSHGSPPSLIACGLVNIARAGVLCVLEGAVILPLHESRATAAAVHVALANLHLIQRAAACGGANPSFAALFLSRIHPQTAPTFLAPCGKPHRTRGGNTKPCVFPPSCLRFTLKSRYKSQMGSRPRPR